MERETTPSQSEWLIMEVFWANDTPTMTAKEVIKRMQEKSDVGKIKFFYENTIGIILFSWWTEICKAHIWINWLYLCGIFVYAARLFYKKRKLKKLVAGMERRILEDTSIYVTKMPVTPSTIGLFRPKIVMPETMLKEYDRKELQTILLHEKTHIQLGHLLFYFLWDILRALLWLNPLLAIGTKFFREDMEEVCD